MSLIPENFAFTFKSFLINVAKFSGIFKSTKTSDVSSNVKITDFSEPRISSVIPRKPTIPLNGAIISESLNLIIISPSFTNFLIFISDLRLFFSILKVLFFFAIAVQNFQYYLKTLSL